MVGPVLVSKEQNESILQISPETSENLMDCVLVRVAPEETQNPVECSTDSRQHFSMLQLQVSIVPTYSLTTSVEGRRVAEHSRQRIWRIIAGDRPLPHPCFESIEDGFGSLAHLFDGEEDKTVEDLLREVRLK